MANPLTEVTNTNFISRIMGSISGIVVGVVLFLAAFGLLWWNEGQVDFSAIAKKAIQIDPGSPNASNDQKLIAATGAVETTETLSDAPYLAPAPYIILNRKAEMYAWKEEKESSSTKNTGGSESTTTTYKYKKEWTNSPDRSSNFKQPDGHTNPDKSIEDVELRTNAVNIGVYTLDPKTIEISGVTTVPLTNQNITVPDGGAINGSYLYLAANASLDPQIGNMRISYTGLLSPKNVTIFGKADGTTITAYVDKNNNKLYRILPGTFDEAISTMHSEYTMTLWILRFVGFLMMWFGLSMVFAPISVLLDILPMFGSLSRLAIGGITFVVALVLSTITILIGFLFHNIIALIVAVVVVAGGILLYLKMKKKSMQVLQQPQQQQSQQQQVTVTQVQPFQVDPQLAEYINTSRTQGMTNDQILQALIAAGWSQSMAMQALGM